MICKSVTAAGGVLDMDDFRSHRSTFDEPIKTDYKGHVVWEIPPSGQGITALMALNILESYDLKSKCFSPTYIIARKHLHIMIFCVMSQSHISINITFKEFLYHFVSVYYRYIYLK